MRYILKRTHTEEFDYDPDKLIAQFSIDYHNFCIETAREREHYGWKPMTSEELRERFLTELFEKHDGSQFGEELFSNRASDDVWCDLRTEED